MDSISIVGVVSRATFTLSLFLLVNLTFTWAQTTSDFNQTAVLLEQIKAVKDGANNGWVKRRFAMKLTEIVDSFERSISFL